MGRPAADSLNSTKTADMDGKTPLHVAAMHNATKVAEWLIKEGVEVNALDALFRTPLFLASACDAPEVQKMLVRCALRQRQRQRSCAAAAAWWFMVQFCAVTLCPLGDMMPLLDGRSIAPSPNCRLRSTG